MLTKEQLADLTHLQELAHEAGVEVVIIGAAALRCFVEFEIFTKDVDLVIALDLEAFTEFAKRLINRGWTQEAKREHRWHGPQGSIIDLLPAGPELCAAGRIVWPASEFTMSLVGFQHVFVQSAEVTFGTDSVFKVAPPQVVALLKIISYMDDPQRRQKDLGHLYLLLRDYEIGSDRLFSDDVFSAELDDIEYANAFLLGLDVGALASDGEIGVVVGFLKRELISDEEIGEIGDDDLGARERRRRAMQLKAFKAGFTRNCQV